MNLSEITVKNKETNELVTRIFDDEDEKAILRNLPEGYKWIARDENNVLCIFPDNPKKLMATWMCELGHRYLDLFDNLFQMVRWEDGKPWKI